MAKLIPWNVSLCPGKRGCKPESPEIDQFVNNTNFAMESDFLWRTYGIDAVMQRGGNGENAWRSYYSRNKTLFVTPLSVRGFHTRPLAQKKGYYLPQLLEVMLGESVRLKLPDTHQLFNNRIDTSSGL
jgi:hypothetical protein